MYTIYVHDDASYGGYPSDNQIAKITLDGYLDLYIVKKVVYALKDKYPPTYTVRLYQIQTSSEEIKVD